MIVVDTDHISVLQHQDAPSAKELRKRLASVDRNEVVVTTVANYEEQIRSWLSQIGRNADVHRQIPFYQRLIQLADFFAEWQLLPFNQDAADTFKQLRRQKIRISSTDLKIASIVLVHNATLLSRNLADFSLIPGLHVENWMPQG